MNEVNLTSLNNDECYELYEEEYGDIYEYLFDIVE